MGQTSHQTVKLSMGRHSSPDQGVCVMELASMLAGEAFSDHPSTVSPAIAAFMRGYNDLVDQRRRDDLYEYAARCVGTARGASVEEARANLLLDWADAMHARRRGWLRRRSGASAAALGRRVSRPEAAGTQAARSIPKVNDETHAAALALVDELIAMGRGGGAGPAGPDIPEAPVRRPAATPSLTGGAL